VRAFIPIKLKPWSQHRSRRVHCVCLLWATAASLFAQGLKVSSGSAARGGRVTLEISLDSSAGQEPVALQWEVNIPAGQLSFVDHNLLPGPAVRAADKFLACAVKLVRSKDGDGFTSVCIVAGGLKPITNGVVALLRLQVSPEARTGLQQVGVTGFAVDKDTGKTPFKKVEATVRVGETTSPRDRPR